MMRLQEPWRHFALALPMSALSMALLPQAARAETALVEAIKAGTPLADLRLRYEAIDQENRPDDAQAFILRARLGYETAKSHGFSALFEFDVVQHIGGESFNDTINGKATYPVIADPDMVTVNRLQLSYGAALTARARERREPDLKLTLGRQRIVFGNERFVGNVGWRQHEQTFDAISVVTTALPKTTIAYAYIAQVNRVFGPESPLGHFDGDSHLINVTFAGLEPYAKLEAFAYVLDFVQAPAASTVTYGFRGEGSYDVTPDLRALLNGSYARQHDHRDNPLALALSYWLVDGGFKYKRLSALAGYEVLAGNGTIGFSTPLATLHAFQGWADTFLTTPADGIKDLYAKASFSFPVEGPLKSLVATVVYHGFEAQRGGIGFGHEWDALIEAKLSHNVTIGLKVADYEGGGPFPDKTVGWAYIGWKL